MSKQSPALSLALAALHKYKNLLDQRLAAREVLDGIPGTPKTSHSRLAAAHAAFDAFRNTTASWTREKLQHLKTLDKEISDAEEELRHLHVQTPQRRAAESRYKYLFMKARQADGEFIMAAAELSPEDLRILNNEGEKLLGRPPFSL